MGCSGDGGGLCVFFAGCLLRWLDLKSLVCMHDDFGKEGMMLMRWMFDFGRTYIRRFWASIRVYGEQ